jgi:hypothetical protein
MTTRMNFHTLAKQQQMAATHQRQADEATRATALTAKALANEGKHADMFAAAHCQGMAAAERQSQEDKAACWEKRSALRAPALVWTQAAVACWERRSALHAPAPTWAKTEAERPRTLAEAADYDEAKCASAFAAANCQAKAEADRQTQAVLAEQQQQTDKATRARAVAKEAQQMVEGAKCAQHAQVLAPSEPSQAPGCTDLASNNTTTSLTNSPMAKPSLATQPPQDEVSVYTVASKTDSSKPSLAATTPMAGGTRSYLVAVAPTTGLCAPAPAFTPVGVTRGDKYTRSGADG